MEDGPAAGESPDRILISDAPARRVRGTPGLSSLRPTGVRRMAKASYDTLTSNTHRLAPPSLESLRDTWTGRPKIASNVSFW